MSDRESDASDPRAAFSAAFEALSPRVYAYARRHCAAADAQDVVSDTFLIAWRRWGDVPVEPLPWLLVVARNTISNRRRAQLRHGRAVDAVVRLADLAAAGADHDVIERSTMLAALDELTELEREALLLIAWDGLSNGAAAAVAGCSVRAFEVRLSRARARLTRLTTDPLRPAPVDALKGRLS
jgi:RNA polymerase sigma factor (sigma-70 family)